MISRIALAGALLWTGLAAAPALAQDMTGAQDSLSAFDETIVVTARKREESLQETPISVSAFTGRGLEARGVQSTEGLAQITPNLTLQNNPSFSGASNSAAIYIRGIGQQDFVPTVEPGVGVYVDGVYVARSLGSILDLVDFERVEVLRGPQGTLFGRNTIGGAISVTTKAPSQNLEGAASIGVGTDNQVIAKGTINLPLSETIALRASVGYFNQDGYVKRVADGKKLGDMDRLTGRVALRVEPKDGWTTDFAFDGTTARENGPPMTLLGINYGRTTDPNTPPFVDIHNTIATVMSGGDRAPCAQLGLDVPGCYDDRYLLGKDKTAGTAPSFSNMDIWGLGMTHVVDITDVIKLKSITAYRHLNGSFARDGDASPETIAQYYDKIVQQQFSQEVQLLGETDRFNWILGGYYFNEQGTNINGLLFEVAKFQSGGDFKNKSLAFFGQGTYKITPELKLTAGLRYTKDKKSFHPDQFMIENRVAFLGAPFNSPIFDPGTRVLPDVTAKVDFSEVTPMVNLAYDVNDDLMTYATWSRGFKSGGFTQRVFPPIIPGVTTPITDPVKAIPSFDPEKVDAYEFGVKFQTPNRSATINLAGFYTKYKDMQVQVFTSVAPVFTNAASASIKGFELETQLRPAPGLYLEATAGLTDASYDEIDQATTFINPANAFERVSKWTLSAAATYEHQLPGGSMLRPRVDWAWRSKFYNNSFNTPQIAQPGYHLVNASLGWTSADEQFSLIAAVKNIADKRYLLSAVLVDAVQAFEGVYNRGREWSLTASFKY